MTVSLPYNKYSGKISVPLTGSFTVNAEIYRQNIDGVARWYSYGDVFGRINKVSYSESGYSGGIRFQQFSYRFRSEHLTHDIYGQVRGAPFQGEALDLFGSSFSLDSKGDINIYTHILEYGIQKNNVIRAKITAGYSTLNLDVFNYRTYALVLGFPRRETLTIFSPNIKRIHYLTLAGQVKYNLFSGVHLSLALRQFIPLKTTKRETEGEKPDVTPGKNVRAYGGGYIDLTLSYMLYK